MDGTRKRRHSVNRNRREWYAEYRSLRFAQRMGHDVLHAVSRAHATAIARHKTAGFVAG